MNGCINTKPNGLKSAIVWAMQSTHEHEAYHQQKFEGGRSRKPGMYHGDQTTGPQAGKWYKTTFISPAFNLQNQLEFKQTFLMGVSPFFFCAAISACVKCKRYCNIWLILVPQIISDISNIELIIPRGEKKPPKHPPLLPLIFPHLKEGHFPGLLH